MNNQTILKSPSAFLLGLLIIAFSLFTVSPVKAQVNVSVNISSQSLWGPVGYDYVEYYYLPETDAFYYVPTGQFIYFNGGNYVFVNSLPSSHQVNLYSTYIVVVNSPKPYLKHNIYINNYGKYKNAGRNHTSIRDSGDEKYFVVKGHPKNGGGGGSFKNENPGNGGRGKNNNQNFGGGERGSKHSGGNGNGGGGGGSQKQGGSHGHGKGR